MHYADLATKPWIDTEGHSYETDGMVSYVPALSNHPGVFVIYKDMVVDMIFHYTNSDEFYIITNTGSEWVLPYSDEFILELVTYKKTVLGQY